MAEEQPGTRIWVRLGGVRSRGPLSLKKEALFDTNILTAFRDASHAKHFSMVQFVDQAEAETVLFVAPQSLYEFWVVATRPSSVNGLGMSVERASQEIDILREAFSVLPDPENLLDEWLDLCRTHGVSGKTAHDARLAAYARLLGISTLVTLNARDFARYGLNVVVP